MEEPYQEWLLDAPRAHRVEIPVREHFPGGAGSFGDRFMQPWDIAELTENFARASLGLEAAFRLEYGSRSQASAVPPPDGHYGVVSWTNGDGQPWLAIWAGSVYRFHNDQIGLQWHVVRVLDNERYR